MIVVYLRNSVASTVVLKKGDEDAEINMEWRYQLRDG
jgi:hypothetical protein